MTKRNTRYPLCCACYADRHLCGLCVDSQKCKRVPVEYIDDSVITTKVKSLLAEDDFLKSFKIGVETRKGTVQLSGSVNSQQAVDKAGEIARSVNGVKSVNNT